MFVSFFSIIIFYLTGLLWGLTEWVIVRKWIECNHVSRVLLLFLLSFSISLLCVFHFIFLINLGLTFPVIFQLSFIVAIAMRLGWWIEDEAKKKKIMEGPNSKATLGLHWNIIVVQRYNTASHISKRQFSTCRSYLRSIMFMTSCTGILICNIFIKLLWTSIQNFKVNTFDQPTVTFHHHPCVFYKSYSY